MTTNNTRSSLSASVALRLRAQNRYRKSWSFKPKSDRKPPIKGDNSENYEKIVDCYLGCRDKMIRVLTFNRVPPWDRDDILQEVVTLALDRGTIRNYEAWMMKTLHFQIIMYFRMNRKFRTRFTHLDPVTLDLVKESQLRLAIESTIGWWHARLDVRKALKSLTPRMQWLIMMKVNGYQDRDIGITTGYSAQSVRKLYSRGIKAMEQALQ